MTIVALRKVSLIGAVADKEKILRRLTQLFSRAKFSPHDVDAAMKDQAIEALVGLRAELEHAREGKQAA